MKEIPFQELTNPSVTMEISIRTKNYFFNHLLNIKMPFLLDARTY